MNSGSFAQFKRRAKDAGHIFQSGYYSSHGPTPVVNIVNADLFAKGVASRE